MWIRGMSLDRNDVGKGEMHCFRALSSRLESECTLQAVGSSHSEFGYLLERMGDGYFILLLKYSYRSAQLRPIPKEVLRCKNVQRV